MSVDPVQEASDGDGGEDAICEPWGTIKKLLLTKTRCHNAARS